MDLDLEMVDEALLTIKDLATELRIKPSTLYAWVGQGKIPCVKMHRLIRFRRKDVQEWLEALQRVASRPKEMALEKRKESDIDAVIARVKRDVYTSPHGEARLTSGPRGKEVLDGAV